jgi:hypothetical protein
MLSKDRILTVAAGLAFVCLAGVAQAQDGPPVIPPHPHATPKPQPKPAANTALLVTCDLACTWTLDGEAKGPIEAGHMAKASAGPGEHIVEATAVGSPDRLQKDVTLEAGHQAVIHIELGPVRDARVAAEQVRQQQEAAQLQEAMRLADLHDHAEQNYKAGDSFFDNQKYSDALPLYMKACEGGYAAGCGDAGYLYQQGKGVTTDTAKGVQLYGKGCNGGYMMACSNLAYMYQVGTGVVLDLGRARELYQQACNGNLGNGCWHLGQFYEQGTGVTKDRTLARNYYQKGCNLQLKQSCEALKVLK